MTLLVISFVILMYCVINGTVILNIFNPEGQGVMQTYQLSSSNLTQSLKPGSGSSGLGTDANDTKIAERTSTDSGSNSGSGETSGTPHERSFFHVLLLFVSAPYACVFVFSSPINMHCICSLLFMPT